MPRFDVYIALDTTGRTAQELADDIMKVLKKFTSIDTIEVKEVGARIKYGETYYRR